MIALTPEPEEPTEAQKWAATVAAFDCRMLEMAEAMEADLDDNGLPDIPLALADWAENERRALYGDR
jgi:hypothetical protein